MIRDRDSWANAIEYWDFQERQAKFIVNSVRVYEFFGYSWRLPLWDNELIEYFKKIPLSYRMNTNLYRKYAVNRLFVDSLSEMGRIDCTTTLFDEVQLFEKITKKIAVAVRDECNFIFHPSSYNNEWAVIWSIMNQNPGIVKVKNLVFGFDYKSHLGHKYINEIISYSRRLGYVPIINGLGTIVFLVRTLDEGDNQ